jgi:predicted ATPase with chaperone activity
LLNAQDYECSRLKLELDSRPENRPESLSELDVRRTILEDLALKTIYLAGSLSVLDLSRMTGLSFEVCSELVHRLRAGLFCQVTGMTGNIPQIAITSRGRSRAVDLLSQNQYAGTAPVSFQYYAEQIRRQSIQKVDVHADDVKRAFAHLVVDDETLHQFGTALNSSSPIFLYGPPGVGKTAMAQVLSQVLAEDEVWIPYAVEIDGQIVTVYDPAMHLRIPKLEPGNHDARWVLCHRPAVLVGGELTAEMLNLQFNAISKFYVGPVQMKANNGVLIIDDFGRQRVRPDELLNRWIVPLDRRVDFLALPGGKTIELPFELLVVFASNMDPNDLIDPAFMRRIQTKIKIGAVSNQQFCEIFRRVANDKRVPFDAEIPNLLIDFVHDTLKQELRSCYPRDIVNQVCWAARYEDRAPYLDRAALLLAIESYFVKGA